MITSFIAKRMFQNQKNKQLVSKPSMFIAMWGVAIGLLVMLLALFIVMGFKAQIRATIAGFGAPLQVANFDANRSFETTPIYVNDSLRSQLQQIEGVTTVQRYSLKPGIIKTKEDFQGIVFKGVGQEYDVTYLTKHLREGRLPHFSDNKASNEVLISSRIAKDLHLACGDKINTYYVGSDIRARRFTVTGIYATNFSEFDKLFILGDIYTATRLNKWKANQVTGIELFVADMEQLPVVATALSDKIDGREDPYGSTYYTQTLYDLYPQLFAWLDLLDNNVVIILILMMGVSGFTMVSGLLILILERTQMIGVLKALGATDWFIQRIFLEFSVYLITRGLLIGNFLALLFYFVQSRFHLLSLDPSVYYVDSVPLLFDAGLWLLINLIVFVVTVSILVAPSFLIAKIRPATSIRFE
ncbi:MAG: ABC transporter permease [Bacteroidaceae bacterium]|nr:ABC transporter permease [Bacteroidaceae bacterium]